MNLASISSQKLAQFALNLILTILTRQQVHQQAQQRVHQQVQSTGLLISPSIRSSTSPSTSPSSPPTSPSTGPSNLCRLLNFAPLSEDEAQKLISNTGKKYCALDPMPTPLMLECLDTLLPVIASQINLSLEYGVFPDIWKGAIGYPLLKKVDLGSSFPNLRLISNLSYISKLTEKAVCQQLK